MIYYGHQQRLLTEEDYIGNYECCKLFDRSVAKLDTAKAHAKTPFFTGRVIAFAITHAVAGIILGNIPEVDDKLLYTPTNDGLDKKDDESDSSANKTTI
ncbi:hypothetical protein PoB_004664100 [Plakobranchus ocellatus]|uniref:Uncharacterized protein n=1 Tax=Plakobranchus ocellatus TaxID=259542 RepID=A0AAV4BI71_9GAST|nr:hypothetical protein PoB_004664100 [Plakobranchus ocellatus]